MSPRYLVILLLIAGVFTLGCTSVSISDTCPIVNAKQMLPARNISDYQRVSFSDNLGSDFYRVLLGSDSTLLSKVNTGVLADYNSTGLPGATMNILIVQFQDSPGAERSVPALLNAVETTISANATTQREIISRNNLSYSSLRITGLTNAHGLSFYQEYVFWQVRNYGVMAKLTTPDIGQDPHQQMLQFMDAMATICYP